MVINIQGGRFTHGLTMKFLSRSLVGGSPYSLYVDPERTGVTGFGVRVTILKQRMGQWLCCVTKPCSFDSMGNGVAKGESLISNRVYSRCNSKAQTIGIPWNVPVGHRELGIIANEVGPFCVELPGEMFLEIRSSWHLLRFLFLFVYHHGFKPQRGH